MATTRRIIDYPTSDGKPMAETDTHRDLMATLIETLERLYRDRPDVYISGNLLYYVEGDRRKHVSPDVFVVFGIPRRKRDHYLAWEEGKGPDVVVELTSKSARSEDVRTKMALYRDVLKVAEYFLFDPYEEYLRPSMQGYRPAEGGYEPIARVEDRLPSRVLGLHLERSGTQLRLFDPATGLRVPTLAEVQRADRAEAERNQLRAAPAEADRVAQQARAARAEAELDRLRRELEALRRGRTGEG